MGWHVGRRCATGRRPTGLRGGGGGRWHGRWGRCADWVSTHEIAHGCVIGLKAHVPQGSPRCGGPGTQCTTVPLRPRHVLFVKVVEARRVDVLVGLQALLALNADGGRSWCGAKRRTQGRCHSRPQCRRRYLHHAAARRCSLAEQK